MIETISKEQKTENFNKLYDIFIEYLDNSTSETLTEAAKKLHEMNIFPENFNGVAYLRECSLLIEKACKSVKNDYNFIKIGQEIKNLLFYKMFEYEQRGEK
jgi:hypothetical protein